MAARKGGSRKRSPSTRAGEYVREEIHHAREGKHPVKNRKQAIAIGLSKARKAGIRVPASAVAVITDSPTGGQQQWSITMMRS
jgi:hypothetical protein